MGSGRRAASGEAAQMNDDIDTLSRRMQEMQRLVEEQRGAMAKLALGRRGRGGEGDGLAPTISQEAARLQLIDEQLEELEDTLRTAHERSQMLGTPASQRSSRRLSTSMFATSPRSRRSPLHSDVPRSDGLSYSTLAGFS